MSGSRPIVHVPSRRLWLLCNPGSSGFVRFTPLWTAMRSTPWMLWWRGLGVYVPLFCLAAFTLWRRVIDAFFFLGFAAVFVMANLIIFQPWEMDNTKVPMCWHTSTLDAGSMRCAVCAQVFYVWVFGASPFVCDVVCRVARRLRFIGPLIGALLLGLLTISGALLSALPARHVVFLLSHWCCCCCCVHGSGVLCSVQETVSDSSMFDLIDVEYAFWLRANTPSTAVFMIPAELYPKHLRVVRCSALPWFLMSSMCVTCAVGCACCCRPLCSASPAKRALCLRVRVLVAHGRACGCDFDTFLCLLSAGECASGSPGAGGVCRLAAIARPAGLPPLLRHVLDDVGRGQADVAAHVQRELHRRAVAAP